MNFPINKNLWTSSFVLRCAGLSLLFLALFYLVIDVWRLRRWAFPLIVIGSNSILIYLAGRFIDFDHITRVFLRRGAPLHRCLPAIVVGNGRCFRQMAVPLSAL